jgi:O-antigen/teichoic acid export membrane protein
MLKDYLKSDFNKNVLTLLTGATLAQLTLLLISPILSRLFEIDDFGNLATLMAIVSPIVIIASLRYELAIVLPEKDSTAVNLFVLALSITLIISLLSLIGVLIFIHSFQHSPTNFNYNWLYFLPMFVFLIGSYQCLNNWGNRLKKYKSLTAYRISNSLTNSSTSLTFGVLKIGGIGLLLGVLLGNIVGLIVLGGTLFSSIKNKWHYVSFIEMRKAAIEYKIFPLANTLQASSDVFQLSGVIYFISYF